MGRKIALTLFVVFLGSALAAGGGRPVRQWTVDLNSSPEVQKSGPIGMSTHTFVTYAGENRIAVGLLFGADSATRRDEKRWRAVLLTVDPTAGKLLRSHIMDNFSGEGAALGTLEIGTANSGDLLAVYGNELLRFSPELEVVARRSLSSTVEERHGINYRDYWHLVVNSAGDSAMLFHVKLDRSMENHWISTKDLSDQAVAPARSRDWRMVLSGHAIVVNDLQGCSALFQDRGAEPRCICRSCKGGAVLASFGHGLVFLGRGPAASYTIVSVRGDKVLDRSKGFGADSIGEVSGSAGSNRVAFVLSGALRLSLFNGWGSHSGVIVVDADLKREVANIDFRDHGQMVKDWQVFSNVSVAMSPDGKGLAVLTGHSLVHWAIP